MRFMWGKSAHLAGANVHPLLRGKLEDPQGQAALVGDEVVGRVAAGLLVAQQMQGLIATSYLHVGQHFDALILGDVDRPVRQPFQAFDDALC